MATKEDFYRALDRELPQSNLTRALKICQGFIAGNQAKIADLYIDENARIFTGLNPTGPIEGRALYKEVIAGFSPGFSRY
ncbi:MAG: hypothetical protein HC875_41305 [Anaerolineales bacterium]|nr:hypothetical protein [Anaerolineales bacterium]